MNGLTMTGNDCLECGGKGYNEPIVTLDEEQVTIKKWCEKCHGVGLVNYEGDRSGIGWERE